MTKSFKNNIESYCLENMPYQSNVKDLFCSEKLDYLKYKKGMLGENSFKTKLNFEVLALLEENGFSVDKIGTYFYKDVIVRIIKRLEWVDTEGYDLVLKIVQNSKKEMLTDNIDKKVKEGLNVCLEDLKEQLNNPFSNFYFDIAKNDNDMGVKNFHNYIKSSFDVFERQRTKNNLLSNMMNETNEKMNYGQLAFQIANYVRKSDFYQNTNSEKEKLSPRKKVLERI